MMLRKRVIENMRTVRCLIMSPARLMNDNEQQLWKQLQQKIGRRQSNVCSFFYFIFFYCCKVIEKGICRRYHIEGRECFTKHTIRKKSARCYFFMQSFAVNSMWVSKTSRALLLYCDWMKAASNIATDLSFFLQQTGAPCCLQQCSWCWFASCVAGLYLLH